MVLTGTAHMLVANVVTSANRPVGAVGGLVYNTSSGNFQVYEGTAWFDRRDIRQMTATGQGTGDIFYADTPTSVARLAAGGSGSVLQANGAAAVAWVPNAGAVALLRNASGSFSATADGTIDSFNVSGLGTHSKLLIMAYLEASGGALQSVYLQGSGNRIARLAFSIPAGSAQLSQTYIIAGSGGTNVVSLTDVGGTINPTGGSVNVSNANYDRNGWGTLLGTAWTGTWSLALQGASMTAGTTLRYYQYSVYHIKDA